MTTPQDATEALARDPWQWLHDNDFSWDDVNAIAAVFAADGWSVVRTEDVERLLDTIELAPGDESHVTAVIAALRTALGDPS